MAYNDCVRIGYEFSNRYKDVIEDKVYNAMINYKYIE